MPAVPWPPHVSTQRPGPTFAASAAARQVPAFLNCHHCGSGFEAECRSMIGFEPLTSGMLAGGSNEMNRSLVPLFELQANTLAVRPPAPRQSFHARLMPPADAIEAVKARSNPLRMRAFFMIASCAVGSQQTRRPPTGGRLALCGNDYR